MVFGPSALEQDVGRFHVAVHEPALMGRIEAVAHLSGQVHCLQRWEVPLPGDELSKVRPVHIAHRDVELAVLVSGIEDRNHVRVVDRRGDPRLALETLTELLIRRQLRRNELHRHPPLERDVGGLEDHPHPPTPRQLVEPVAGNHVTDRERNHRSGRESLARNLDIVVRLPRHSTPTGEAPTGIEPV